MHTGTARILIFFLHRSGGHSTSPGGKTFQIITLNYLLVRTVVDSTLVASIFEFLSLKNAKIEYRENFVKARF